MRFWSNKGDLFMINKNFLMAALFLILGSVAAPAVAQQVVINFDDILTPPPTETLILSPYQGLNWSNFYVVDGTAYPGTGYNNGRVSGNFVAFNGGQLAASTSSTTPFSFCSAYLTGAYNALQITVEGLVSGVVVSGYSQTVNVNTTGPTFVNFNFNNIDEVRFTPSNPTDGISLYFAMDDMAVVLGPSCSASADLVVTVADTPDPVTAGAGSVTYTVTVTNNGPSDASGVAVNIAETFPPGVTEGAGTPSPGTTWASPTWTVGALAAGASATLTLTVNVAASATAGTDVISVTATASGAEPDPNSANDTATASTTIQAQAQGGAANIPTLQEWALLLMGLLLGGLVWRQSRRKGRMSA